MLSFHHHKQTILSYLKTHKVEGILCIIPLTLFLLVSVPGIVKGSLCPQHAEYCTPLQAFIYSWSTGSTTQEFSQGILEENIRKELQHILASLESAKTSQDLTKQIQESFSPARIITISRSIISDNPEIKSLIEKGWVSIEEYDMAQLIVKKTMLKNLLYQMDGYVNEEVKKQEERAATLIPSDISETSYIQFFDTLAKAFRDRGYPFTIESLVIGKNTEHKTEIYDILPITIRFTTKESVLREIIPYLQLPETKSLVANQTFRPLMTIDQMKLTYIGVPSDQDKNTAEQRNIRVESTIHAYVQAVSDSQIQGLIAEIQELRQKADLMKQEKKELSAAEQEQIKGIEKNLQSYNQSYLISYEQKDLRKTFSTLIAMKKLYEDLLTLYL